MILKTSLFDKLHSYRIKMIAFVKFCFFSFYLLISMLIKAGPEQQTDNNVFPVDINCFTEPGRWIFKELVKEVVPINIKDGRVLLAIDRDFFKNNNLDPDQSTDEILESYMVLCMMQMLDKHESARIFTHYNDLSYLNEEDSNILNQTDLLSHPFSGVELCDMSAYEAFKKSISEYSALGTFTFGGCVDNTPICKVWYNNQKTEELYPLGKYADVHIETVSENTRSVLSTKPKIKRKTYECKVCGRGGYYNIKKHISTHTKDGAFKCSTCNKTYNYESDLNVHVKAHAKVGLFACVKCSKIYHHKGSLTQHERTHISGNTFSCNRCEEKFKSGYFLRAHKALTHSNESLAICNVCDKGFRLQNNLQAHMKIHSGAYHFACKVCYKTFPIKHNVKRHMIEVHKVEADSCLLNI